jgi:hypothetical protein
VGEVPLSRLVMEERGRESPGLVPGDAWIRTTVPGRSECGWAQSEPDSGGTPDSGVACRCVVVLMC